MNNKLILGGVALALLLGVIGLFSPAGTPVNQIVQMVRESLGAQSQQVTSGNCFTLNGVNKCVTAVTMGAATTTPAAIQSPAATSTLVYSVTRFSVSTTSASVVTLARATTRYATTTLIGAGSLAAGAQGTLVFATSTLTGQLALDGAATFPPSTWLVMGMQGNPGTYSPTGTLIAEFVY